MESVGHRLTRSPAHPLIPSPPYPFTPSPSRAPIRRYHFHPPGLIYVLVTLFIAVGALNSQNNLLFATLGLAIGGLLASGVLSGSALLGVRVVRETTPPGTVGAPLTLRYTVRNANRLMPVFGLHVEEVPRGPSLRDGTPGSPTGPGAVLLSAQTFVVHVGPGEFVRAAAVVVPRVRGEAVSAGVRVWSTFPFGLVKKSLFFPLHRTVEVRPAALPLRRGLVQRLSARAAAGVGAEPMAGAGEEFFGLREYVAGDNPRRIAWRASARTGELVVRQHSLPSPIRMWVVLRFGTPSRTDEDRVERAIALGASLLRHADEAGVGAGLCVPRAAVAIPPRVERRHLDRMLRVLARLDPSAPRPDPERFPESAARSGRGAVCVIVHAGAIDRSFGPRHARHLEAARLHEWVEDTDEGRALVAILVEQEARA